jgi:hypothetical protein
MELSKIKFSGRGEPQSCETSRSLHFLDNRFTDGGKVVSLTSRPLSTPQKYFLVFISVEAESTPRHVW